MSNLLFQKNHNKLKDKFQADIFREKEITNKYGGNFNGVDHLIYIDEYMITIQDKWESTSPDISHIHKFIGVTNELKKRTGRKLLCALFVSKIKMTRNGNDILKDANNKYTNNRYYSISGIDMDKTINKVISHLENEMNSKGLILNNNAPKFITLRDDQKNEVDAFKTKLLNPDGIKSGIIVKPTGSGKTIVAISCVGEYMKKYNGSVMWITERIDVLKSQFDDEKKLQQCINSKFINI